MPLPPTASTRRIATVVSSVPDATRASSRTARFAAPPVPMINRDVKLRPAMVSFESATLHRRHHFDVCTVGKRCSPAGSRQDGLVDRDRDAAVRVAQRLQQRCNRGVVVDLEIVGVDADYHAPLLLIALLALHRRRRKIMCGLQPE